MLRLSVHRHDDTVCRRASPLQATPGPSQRVPSLSNVLAFEADLQDLHAGVRRAPFGSMAHFRSRLCDRRPLCLFPMRLALLLPLLGHGAHGT